MSVGIITTTATFRDSADALTNCTAYTLRYRKDGGDWIPFTGTITNPSTGLYSAQVTVNEYGSWTVEWYGTIANGLERTRTAQVDVV